MPENNQKNEIEWLDGDIPLSTLFDDPYFSKANGLEETRHVFISGNRLQERWNKKKHFVIGELGFGTGLNFLTTVLEWEKNSTVDQHLRFISYEKYPMSASQMEKALGPWDNFSGISDRLIEIWDDALMKDIPLVEAKWSKSVTLIVHFGDANDLLEGQSDNVDAWFLDGFSPAKNPELWNLDLMQTVFEKTNADGTFATYTSAGWVRRNLVEAGFNVERIKGHAGKRQMSIGNK